MALIYGLGSPDFLTAGLNPERLLPVEPMEFSIEAESEKKESKKFKDGLIVTAGSAQTSEKYTMKIKIEAANWLAIQFAYGELAGITTSVALPEIKYASVPTTAPYVITDADITSTTVWTTVTTAGTWGKAGPLAKETTTPTAAGFVPDGTAHTLTFHSSRAGAPVAYRVFKTYSNIESIGAETVFTAFSSFSFSGIIYGDEEKIKIVIPKITRTNIPTLNVSDLTSFELDFDLIVSGSDRKPFKLYNLSTLA